MEQTQVVLSPHSLHFQSHRQGGELPRADLQSYQHTWDFHCDFPNCHRPEEGLQRTAYMKQRCYRASAELGQKVREMKVQKIT